jgi:hypothetical protein
MAQPIETSLLVVAAFTDRGGREYLPGDRALLQHRNVRLAALELPQHFVMEYETAEVDVEWLRKLDPRYEAEYEQAKRAREAEKAGRQQALRNELEEQEKRDPRDLARRFKRQEQEREQAKKTIREDAERHALERDLALANQRSGFHYDD